MTYLCGTWTHPRRSGTAIDHRKPFCAADRYHPNRIERPLLGNLKSHHQRRQVERKEKGAEYNQYHCQNWNGMK